MNVETLKKRTQFLEIQRKGASKAMPAFVFCWMSIEEPVVRIGFTATKKTISKAAVKRNRAKRRLKALTDELIRLNPAFSLPDGMAGMHSVLIARPASLSDDYERMKHKLKGQLETIGCTVA